MAIKKTEKATEKKEVVEKTPLRKYLKKKRPRSGEEGTV